VINRTKYILIYALPIVVFFLASVRQAEKDPSGYEVVKGMFYKSSTIKTITYTMKKQERFKGIMLSQQSFVKVQYSPLKVYLRQELPKAGLEVLYVHGKNNNLAVVNTNGFPWVNLNLDPMGSIMRENQHHTLLESGHAHMVSILEHLANKYGAEVEKFISNSGTLNWKGRPCWLITFTNPHFTYYKRTLKQGENLLTISAKEKLSEYMILELNKNLDGYKDVSAGQIITVPNDYSPKLELYIDKQIMMPLVMKVYDEKGLYENYEYDNVIINPTYGPKEFDKDFPGYSF